MRYVLSLILGQFHGFMVAARRDVPDEGIEHRLHTANIERIFRIGGNAFQVGKGFFRVDVVRVPHDPETHLLVAQAAPADTSSFGRLGLLGLATFRDVTARLGMSHVWTCLLLSTICGDFIARYPGDCNTVRETS